MNKFITNDFSRQQVNDKLRKKFIPLIKDFIHKVENSSYEDIYDLQLNLTNKGITPQQLWKLMQELNYIDSDYNTNGWQLDFWLSLKKDGYKTLSMRGRGITFELFLEVDDSITDKEIEIERLKLKDDIDKTIKEIKELLGEQL